MEKGGASKRSLINGFSCRKSWVHFRVGIAAKKSFRVRSRRIRMRRIVRFLMTSVIFFTVVAGVTTAQNLPGKSTKPMKDWKIAVVTQDDTVPWFIRLDEGATQFAKDTGINAFHKGPARLDAAMQVQVIQDLIAQGVDALAIVPVEPASLEPVLAQALDNGIVVVTHEGSTQENTLYDIEAFNNSGYGAFIMDNLAKAMNYEGAYTTMVAHVTTASHNEWADAAIARQKAKYPNMSLLAARSRVESQGNLERGYEVAKELFKSFPQLKGIVGTASGDAPGTARAIEELGLKGKAFVVGTGLASQCRPFLKDGTLTAVTLWDPKDAGYAMCALAVKVLKGEKINDGVDLGVKGYTHMTFAPGSKKILQGAGWFVLTKENVDQYNF
jgi:simple sugar transport system substrate-binding protein